MVGVKGWISATLHHRSDVQLQSWSLFRPSGCKASSQPCGGHLVCPVQGGEAGHVSDHPVSTAAPRRRACPASVWGGRSCVRPLHRALAHIGSVCFCLRRSAEHRRSGQAPHAVCMSASSLRYFTILFLSRRTADFFFFLIVVGRPSYRDSTAQLQAHSETCKDTRPKPAKQPPSRARYDGLA